MYAFVNMTRKEMQIYVFQTIVLKVVCSNFDKEWINLISGVKIMKNSLPCIQL